MVGEKNHILLIALLLLVSSYALRGQDVVVSKQITNPRVTCFAQDSLGRIWIGTKHGVNRYNGYDYHQYINGAVPGNEINDILCDSRGNVWIGTDNGVGLYSGSSGFETCEVDSDERNVAQVFEDDYGRIFINLTEDLCVLDTLSGKFVRATTFFDRHFQYHQKCHIGSDSLLWVVGARGVRTFDTFTMENVNNSPIPVAALLSHIFRDGKILLGSGKSFFLFDCETEECLRLTDFDVDGDVELIGQYLDGKALVKTHTGSSYVFDESSRTLSQVEFGFGENFNITASFVDRDGCLWVGSSSDGYRTILAGEKRFNFTKILAESFSSVSVESLCMDPEGRLWIMTGNGGIFVFDGAGQSLREVRPDGQDVSRATDILQTNPPHIYVDPEGRIWLVLPNQRKLHVCRFHNGRLEVMRSFDAYYPKCFASDPEGNVWVGLRNEMVMKFDSVTLDPVTIQVFPFTNTSVNAISLVNDRIIVAAYNTHLSAIDYRTGAVSHVGFSGKTESDLSRGGVFRPAAMRFDGRYLWIGTQGDGLLRYDPSDEDLERMTSLPANEISSIEIQNDGALWVSTPNHLYAYDSKAGNSEAFTAEDGIGGDYFIESVSCTGPGGVLYFGGTHGITEVNSAWEDSSPGSGFVFEDLVTDDGREEITGEDCLVLNHNHNSFHISFAEIDTGRQLRAAYRCRLDGYDSDWRDLGHSREISYSDLKAGKYVFRVECGGMEHSIRLRITPSVWMTWWMISIYLILGIVLVGIFWELARKVRKERAAVRTALAEREMERKQSDMNLRFFSNISHEFRTPLTMIYGPAEQLANSPSLTESEKGFMKMMLYNINRMLSLVNQLLDIGKLDNDTLKLSVSYSDISEMVKMCCTPFALSFEQNGISLDLDLGSSPIYGLIDVDKIQKILSNLLSNASKFTPHGGLVTVRLVREGDGIVLTVVDTGPGIPEDQMERIFDRYYQIDKSSTGKYNYGTGIGLYYARALAKVHHGSLSASNAPDGGAVFTLSIPVGSESFAPEEVSVDGKPAQIGPVESVPALADMSVSATADARQCILVIDDDRDLLNYLNNLLSPRYRVHICEDAEKGLEIARTTSPDLILSDVMMPGKSGLDLCRELKDDLQTCHIPVILVTAKGSVDSQVEGLEQGADAYVTKPFSPSFLLALIRSQTENRLRLQRIINQSTGVKEIDGGNMASKDRAFMSDLYVQMDRILDQESADIASIADSLGVSRTKFYYKIKSLTGKAPSEFLMQYRLNVAANLLKEGKMNVSEVAYAVGFSTLAHFSKSFKKQFGIPPSKFV